MEFFADVVVFGLVVAISLILALIATWASRRFERGRVALIFAAFFSPALFLCYWMYANALRQRYHTSRGEAGEYNGMNTVPLQKGYQLSYFYETPEHAFLSHDATKTDLRGGVDNVQRVAIVGDTVFGETGEADMADSPPDFFFAVDLSSGEIREFGTEAELRSRYWQVGKLRRPQEIYEGELAKERDSYFWPATVAFPFLFFGLGWLLIQRVRGKKPAGEVGGLLSS